MRKHRTQTGQGLPEYALILVLVAVVVIVILVLLGPSIGAIYNRTAISLGHVGQCLTVNTAVSIPEDRLTKFKVQLAAGQTIIVSSDYESIVGETVPTVGIKSPGGPGVTGTANSEIQYTATSAGDYTIGSMSKSATIYNLLFTCPNS